MSHFAHMGIDDTIQEPFIHAWSLSAHSYLHHPQAVPYHMFMTFHVIPWEGHRMAATMETNPHSPKNSGY